MDLMLPATAPPRPQWETSPGLVAYPEALARMAARAAAVRAGEARELVWLLEHPPLYTAGTSAAAEELIETRFPVYDAGRGGRWTYHGPGQRVVYVILDLKQRGMDLKRHVWRLEELAIRTLAELGVRGERRCDRIGVWVAEGARECKIAAVGVRVRRWVTFHGLAINVAPDLAHFRGIVPCGIREHGVTSLAALGTTAGMAEVDAALRRHFDVVFSS